MISEVFQCVVSLCGTQCSWPRQRMREDRLLKQVVIKTRGTKTIEGQEEGPGRKEFREVGRGERDTDREKDGG